MANGSCSLIPRPPVTSRSGPIVATAAITTDAISRGQGPRERRVKSPHGRRIRLDALAFPYVPRAMAPLLIWRKAEPRRKCRGLGLRIPHPE